MLYIYIIHFRSFWGNYMFDPCYDMWVTRGGARGAKLLGGWSKSPSHQAQFWRICGSNRSVKPRKNNELIVNNKRRSNAEMRNNHGSFNCIAELLLETSWNATRWWWPKNDLSTAPQVPSNGSAISHIFFTSGSGAWMIYRTEAGNQTWRINVINGG